MSDKEKFKTRIKKNDSVKVISGNSKGAVGKVLFIDRDKGKSNSRGSKYNSQAYETEPEEPARRNNKEENHRSTFPM